MKKPKSKKKEPPKSKLITAFTEKRKLESPNRAPNPSLLKRVQVENIFSLGLDDLADSFNDSLDLDDYVPLSAKVKAT